MKRYWLLIALPLVLGFGGCAHVLSQEALNNIDKGVDFVAVKADPSAHKGVTLALGGLIVETTTNREGTTLEVLRYHLDRWGEPRRVDEAGGRFLVVTDRFLDPEIYAPGFFVTLTGTVVGEETRELRGDPYRYPVFRLGEIYSWWRQSSGYVYGSYYFGPYYDPWWPYRPYWYEPYWWYDPFWPRHYPPLPHRGR